MQLLADENFPQVLVQSLREHGHDVLWARTVLPGRKDKELLELAEYDRRLVLTLDRDFWQIAVQRRSPLVHSGAVLFRVHPATPRTLTPLLGTSYDWNAFGRDT